MQYMRLLQPWFPATRVSPEEISLGFETLQAFMTPVPWLQVGLTKSLDVPTHGVEVVESFNRLASGIPVRGLCGERTDRTLRCLVTDFLGDWKWHRDSQAAIAPTCFKSDEF